MLLIVGTRIYLHEGDECSFRVVYKDREGDIHNFHPDDIITMTVRDINKKLIIRKEAISISLGEESALVLIFNYSDYNTLKYGDYSYELSIISNSGYKQILIDKAWLHVIEDKSSTRDLLGDEFVPHRLENYDSNLMSISSTPLVCRYDYETIQGEEVPGTLILFNHIRPKEEIDNNPDDDTLILFNNRKDEEDEEDTLILF